MTTVAFMQTLIEAMEPDLRMWLLRQDDQCALYAGLWSTWCAGVTPFRSRLWPGQQ